MRGKGIDGEIIEEIGIRYHCGGRLCRQGEIRSLSANRPHLLRLLLLWHQAITLENNLKRVILLKHLP